MKKLLLPIVVVLPFVGQAQFSSGTVNLNAANMTVKLDVDAVKVKLKVTGADNSMLGIGFGSQGMANGSFGFIFSSNANNDFIFKGS
ncbi:MAG TPA: hypothetical protein PKX92_03145 [Edaphocola sp.]|nr:hypothetical protein [Edaphocola sp.]